MCSLDRTAWLAMGSRCAAAYQYLSQIKPGYTEDSIMTLAQQELKNMGAYSVFNNNCNTFVDQIAAKMNAF